MSDEKPQSMELNIPGDGHTFIGNANEVNISGEANVFLAGEVVKREVVPFGENTICLEDSNLREEFKKDYDELIIKCIKTDYKVSGVDINLYDEIDLQYRDKWDVKMLKFKRTLVPARAFSKGCTIQQVEILSNKLLTTAFEASLECITVM